MTPHSAQTFSLVSSKGGVGKSTFAINVACAMADMGMRVLCVDLDSQQSLSKFFEYATPPTAGLIEFITQQRMDAVTASHIKDVDVIINNDNGEKLNEWMSEQFSGSFALKKILARLKNNYDAIIIDTQGKDGRGQLQEMALIAADTVIVPTTPDVMSSQELPRAIDIYSHVIHGLVDMGLGSDQPPALKILINREDRTSDARNVTAYIREHYVGIARHISVLKTAVPQRVVWKNCISQQQPAHRIDSKRVGDPKSAILVMEQLIHELVPYYADVELGVGNE